MHVTSNPYFAFHDDVFPAFAKNNVAQSTFPRNYGPSTIIPAEFFISLKELTHISTVEIKWNGTERFSFEIKFPESSQISEETKILKCTFFDGSTLLSFGAYKNSSLWISSDFFDRRIILQSSTKRLSDLKIELTSSPLQSPLLEIFEEQ